MYKYIRRFTMKNPEVLLYEEVNSEKLLSILNQAYISGHLDDDGTSSLMSMDTQSS